MFDYDKYLHYLQLTLIDVARNTVHVNYNNNYTFRIKAIYYIYKMEHYDDSMKNKKTH